MKGAARAGGPFLHLALSAIQDDQPYLGGPFTPRSVPMHLLSRATTARLATLTASFAVTLAIPLATPLGAQGDRPTPSTYAITNARLVPVSSAPIERGTIVIRDGLIVAIGASVATPADARIVDGTGLTVYPGLIDAYTTLGMRAPAAGQGGGGGFGGGAPVARPAGAPNSTMPIGLQPEVRAFDQLVENSDFSAAHAAGITTALTAPSGRIYEGQSALISLGSGDFSTVAIRTPVALHVGFQGIGGGQFPGSLMGVFAALRQSLLDAQQYRTVQAAYARNPRGMRRPAVDPSMEALQPVLAGTMPVVFRASTQREIERALELAKEFNLKPIIAGGSEAYRVIDRLKASGAPVLLSLNFPRRSATPAAPAATPAAAAEPEPLRVLRDRVQAPKTPAQLQAAGIRFALQSGGGAYTEFLPNLRRAVEGGLAADAALRALTLGSAELLGAADRLGSLEAGKIANLTIVRGDLFASDSRVTHVYVDGRPQTIPAPTVAAGPGGPGGPGGRRPGLEGAWTLSVVFEGVEKQATLTISSMDDRLVGRIEGDFGSNEVAEIAVMEDGTVRFGSLLTLKETSEEALFRGKLADGVFAGTIEIIGHASGRFAGLRVSTTNQER